MTTSIQLVLRTDKTNKKGDAPIYFRIIKNRRSTNIYTGIRIQERYWDNDKKLVKTVHPNSTRMNNLLRIKEIQLRDDILKIEAKDVNASIVGIKEKLLHAKNNDFFTLAETIIEGYYNRGQIGTYDQRRSVIKKLKEYCNSSKLLFSEIDIQFIKAYKSYLIVTKGNSTNTVYNNLKFIRQIFNTAVREGYIEQKDNPFGNITLHTVKTNREYLLQQEIDAIEALQFENGSRLEKHRDMFIFACYACGLRISDVLLLKWKHILDNRINITIRKTGAQTSVYIPKKAMAILNKYKTEHCNKDQYIFGELHQAITPEDPVKLDISISRLTAIINKNLKTIASKAGIDKKVSFHVSRHSFATNALRKGIPIEHVQKLLGHANIRETLIYAKIVSADLDESMKVFDD